jgi:hypothetical protein
MRAVGIVATVALAAAAAIVALTVLRSADDIKRYLKIRSM